jgi:hypothetical protein
MHHTNVCANPSIKNAPTLVIFLLLPQSSHQFLPQLPSLWLLEDKQSRSVEDKGCKMQSKVIIYIKFAKKDETKEHGSFIDLVMLASFTRRFKEKL